MIQAQHQQTILFIVNVDWFFISHRLPIAIRLLELGHRVAIACADTGKAEYLRNLGLEVYCVPISRTSLNPISEIRTFVKLMSLVKELKADVVHAVTIKPVIYGGFARRISRVPAFVASISGLGYVFTEQRLQVRILRKLIKCMYQFALGGSGVKVIFQNGRDRELFEKARIVRKSQSVMIKGSGVSLDKFSPSDLPSGPMLFLFVARLLKDKGVCEFVEAARSVKAENDDCRFVIVGSVDADNPNSISSEDLDLWRREGIIEYWGFSENVASVIAQGHVMVLPSFYAEGLPKSLIEAAACARPIITTDMPGCRDAVEPGKTGLLVPPRDVRSLVSAMQFFIDHRLDCEIMGQRGRKFAEEMFDIETVIDKHLEIYEIAA